MASDCWLMDVCNQSAGVSMNAPFEANWRMEDIFHLISAGIITFLDTKMVSGTSTCVCFLYLPMDSGSEPAATLARCIRHHVVPGINDEENCMAAGTVGTTARQVPKNI